MEGKGLERMGAGGWASPPWPRDRPRRNLPRQGWHRSPGSQAERQSARISGWIKRSIRIDTLVRRPAITFWRQGKLLVFAEAALADVTWPGDAPLFSEKFQEANPTRNRGKEEDAGDRISLNRFQARAGVTCSHEQADENLFLTSSRSNQTGEVHGVAPVRQKAPEHQRKALWPLKQSGRLPCRCSGPPEAGNRRRE